MEDIKERGVEIKNIMDVGANETSWSREIQRIFNSANFFLIEPQAEMKEYLITFCNDFPGSRYYLTGVGNKCEDKYLTIWDDLQGSSFLPALDNKLIANGSQRMIEMLTIDKILVKEDLPIPDLIKLDIQGYELTALEGATKLFGKTEVFILEVSLFQFHSGMPIFFDVINFMNQRGYVVYDLLGFLRRPIDGALGQCDLCFVKNNGLLRKTNTWN
jgi:FkbM family methyltransferase